MTETESAAKGLQCVDLLALASGPLQGWACGSRRTYGCRVFGGSLCYLRVSHLAWLARRIRVSLVAWLALRAWVSLVRRLAYFIWVSRQIWLARVVWMFALSMARVLYTGVATCTGSLFTSGCRSCSRLASQSWVSRSDWLACVVRVCTLGLAHMLVSVVAGTMVRF